MTLVALMSLQEVIREALVATSGGLTGDIIRWLQMNRREILDANQLTIEAEGLGQIIRKERKEHGAPKGMDVEALCLDFGLDPLDLDGEVSVPQDMERILSGPCEWPKLDDVTIDDIDKHVLLLEATSKSIAQKTTSMRVLRQAAALVVPGRTDIPLRELRVIARQKRAE